MTIGERIKYRREELNLSQMDLAIKLGYKSRSSVNKIELGLQNLTQSKIKAVADALDTTPAYIMGWEEGIPTSITENEDAFNEIYAIFSGLSPDNQAKLLELARLYLDDQRRNEENQ